MGKQCPSCGHPLADGSRFCGQCGLSLAASSPPDAMAPAPPAPPPAAAAEPVRTVVDPKAASGPAHLPRVPHAGARTMVGYAVDDVRAAGSGALRPLAPGAAPAAPPPPAAEAPPPQPIAAAGQASPRPANLASVKRTMVGVSALDVLQAAQAPGAQAGGGPAPSSGGGPPAPSTLPEPRGVPVDPPRDPRKGTMMGVAIPGIAPLAATEPAPNRRAAAGTMLGVAVPGVAPTQGSEPPPPLGAPAAVQRTVPRKAVEIVPMPPPLVDDEPDVGPAPRLVKRGLPLAAVAGGIAALVSVAGVAAFLLLRSPPLVAQPRIDAQGHELLHLVCQSCQDGTVAELYDARATFKGKETDLLLTSPLRVGNNPLTIHIDRPNLGRDESVQVVVPVAFRIRADLADLSAAKPVITVKVEAVPGTDVRVDNKPVSLDASGDGSYALELSSETEGLTDNLQLIDRIIPYSVTPPKAGEAQTGKLTVRVGIAPLHLDAPGTHAVVDAATFRLAGRTVKGGSVTVNGAAVQVAADGTFSRPFDIASAGDLPVEVRASAAQLAPRTARFTVKRVEHLSDEAAARESSPELTYDAIASDLNGAVGKNTIVEGDVVEARTTAMQTVAIIDDTRGCAKGPCLVRVLYGGDLKMKHGDVARAYGRVTRSVAYGSSTVPEVEADFALPGRAPGGARTSGRD